MAFPGRVGMAGTVTGEQASLRTAWHHHVEVALLSRRFSGLASARCH